MDDLPEWTEEAGPVIGIEDFEDIFSRFQTPLTNFVYRLVGNREQAYDLTQDVFVKAYRALSSGTTIQAAALSSWLYRIASNTATDALRRRRLISWLPLSLFNEDRGVGAGMPGADSASSSSRRRLRRIFPSSATAFASSYDGGRFEQQVADREIVQSILQRLPPKYATCLLLYEHEGFSCAEIAEVLNVSPVSRQDAADASTRAFHRPLQTGNRGLSVSLPVHGYGNSSPYTVLKTGDQTELPRSKQHLATCPACRQSPGGLPAERRSHTPAPYAYTSTGVPRRGVCRHTRRGACIRRRLWPRSAGRSPILSCRRCRVSQPAFTPRRVATSSRSAGPARRRSRLRVVGRWRPRPCS